MAEADRLPPHIGALTVERQPDGRRVARLIPRNDSPHAWAPAHLFDPAVLTMTGDKFVLEGREAGWDSVRQKPIEQRQTWGCRWLV